ncbi:MAG: hypothetical protein LLG44_14510 [Chloroflexi bacterium]|nr:hypothetical protein [Chloroflexota bacterium]
MSSTLATERLAIEIALPGEAPNTTFRFDRAGFITRVTLDGVHNFCTREPANLAHPCSGGVGLCSEYQANALAQEAQIGEQFLKPGIGLLTKTEAVDYIFYKQYQAELSRISIERHPDAVTFVAEPLPCRGYALRLTKQVKVEGTALTMTMQADNVGEWDIELNEYCHNFITIDGLPIGPGYCLEFNHIAPQDGKLTPEENGTFTTCGRVFSFSAYNPKAAMAYLAPEDILTDTPFYWELSHTASPARVRESDSFHPSAAAIWAIDHIISPEVFYRVALRPRENSTWARTWVFSA